MSEGINYEKRVILFDQPVSMTNIDTGKVTHIKSVIVSASQMQQRPRSTPTRRVGAVYVTPTAWSHKGAMTSAPMTSGRVRPNGLRIIYAWDYLAGMFEVGTPLYPSVPTLARASELERAATTQCLLNLKDQKVNLGVALAEAKEAAELVANATRRVTKLMQSAYDRNPKEWLSGVRRAGSKSWKKTPGYYLEHVYGIVPILSDVDGVCQQLAKTYARGNSPEITAFGVKKDTENVDLALSSMQQFGEMRGIGRQQNIAKVGIVANAPSWVMQDYSSLGVTNPFAIAWERAPYSHVIDWFLPVGDWINTWDVSNYLMFKSGYSTRFAVREGAAVVKPNPTAHLWDVRVDLPGRFRHWSMDRVVLTKFPSASYPSLRNGLSLNRMAQGLAMLTNVVRNHKRLANLDLHWFDDSK